MIMMADIECPVVRADVTCYWKDMWRRLDAMRRLWQLCDVRLKTDDGSSFMAHSPVLAASSDVLHHMLVATRHETFVEGSGIVPVRDIAPDVLRITLDFIYGVTPTSRADFERLRIGATRLGIEGAYEYCCRRLGENVSSLYPYTRYATEQSSTLLVATTEAVTMVEATAVVEPPPRTISNDPTSRTEEASVGDWNSSAALMQSDAIVSVSEMSVSSDTVDAVDPPSDVHHSEMMAHVTLVDLARSDECPHLRRLAGETLPLPSIPKSDHLAHESDGSADDRSGFLDPVLPTKSIGTSVPSDSRHSSTREVASGLFENETASDGDVLSIVAAQTCNSDLSSSAHTAVLISSGIQTSSRCPQTILAGSITGDGSHCSTFTRSDTASSNIVGSGVDFGNSSYETPGFPAASVLKSEMMTCLAQDPCMSYVGDNYPMTAVHNNSLWLSDGHSGMAMMKSDLSSLTSCVQPKYGVGSFASVLSTGTADVSADGNTANSVYSSTTDIVHRSSNILHGCPQDVNYTDYAISPNHWPEGIAASSSRAPPVNGISQVVSMPSDTNMAYFSPNLVANAAVPFVPPVLTMNALSSSSSALSASSSVTAAGGITADLSYISLDDVSAVLKANGFNDKTSSPSASEVLPENRTADKQVVENQTSDVEQTGANTAANEAQSAGTRVCIFCQKPCKSER